MKARCNELLNQYNMTHSFFHGPLDDADFGTSASLAVALGIDSSKGALPYKEVFNGGRIGELKVAVTFEQLSETLSGVLEEGCDTYITGEYALYSPIQTQKSLVYAKWPSD